ncbi:MAG: rhomboid family intramembrane serine protease, partial [Phycisphaerales bacterium]|nr:rhomboid family intramembrane serine protease [Phycisphaerales bacterium]
MFLPIRTERQPRRTPRVTQAIILLNLLVYLAGVLGEAFGRLEPGAMQEAGQFVMSDFRAWQLFTYQFMHDPHGLGHLAFNMLFLWIFGTSVEDRLGRVGFICFYLLGGAAAGLVHGWIAPRIGIIGASGSIAAVTGAFMVLFPRSHIVIISLFGVFTPPAPWVILFFVAMDLFRASGSFGGGDNVAHAAHLAGYGYGIAIAFTLLATGLLARDDLDLFFLFKQKRRRNQFKTLSRRQVGGAWADRSKDTAEQAAATIGPGRLSARDQRIAELRAEITRRAEAHDLAGATRSYLDLIALDPTSTLSET